MQEMEVVKADFNYLRIFHFNDRYSRKIELCLSNISRNASTEGVTKLKTLKRGISTNGGLDLKALHFFSNSSNQNCFGVGEEGVKIPPCITITNSYCDDSILMTLDSIVIVIPCFLQVPCSRVISVCSYPVAV